MCLLTPVTPSEETGAQGLCELSMLGLMGALTIMKVKSFVSVSPKFNVLKNLDVVILKFISLW